MRGSCALRGEARRFPDVPWKQRCRAAGVKVPASFGDLLDVLHVYGWSRSSADGPLDPSLVAVATTPRSSLCVLAWPAVEATNCQLVVVEDERITHWLGTPDAALARLRPRHRATLKALECARAEHDDEALDLLESRLTGIDVMAAFPRRPPPALACFTRPGSAERKAALALAGRGRARALRALATACSKLGWATHVAVLAHHQFLMRCERVATLAQRQAERECRQRQRA